MAAPERQSLKCRHCYEDLDMTLSQSDRTAES